MVNALTTHKISTAKAPTFNTFKFISNPTLSDKVFMPCPEQFCHGNL